MNSFILAPTNHIHHVMRANEPVRATRCHWTRRRLSTPKRVRLWWRGGEISYVRRSLLPHQVKRGPENLPRGGLRAGSAACRRAYVGRGAAGFLRARPWPHQQRGPPSYVLVLGRGLLKRKPCGNGETAGRWDPRSACMVSLRVSAFPVSVRLGCGAPLYRVSTVDTCMMTWLSSWLPGFFPNCFPGLLPPLRRLVCCSSPLFFAERARLRAFLTG
ncbi:hypothetical protein BHE74_00059544 [Ensete ventricosum]|nr:hypothetical protein GW17_00034211 [Ensete ventricosum]RWW35514.1 hypothetical protein BHE74_00059544 [Ensete ventricosum]RZS01008.1 hypothetical protein BHM03_00030801 [Ensete ventricosum]